MDSSTVVCGDSSPLPEDVLLSISDDDDGDESVVFYMGENAAAGSSNGNNTNSSSNTNSENTNNFNHGGSALSSYNTTDENAQPQWAVKKRRSRRGGNKRRTSIAIFKARECELEVEKANILSAMAEIETDRKVLLDKLEEMERHDEWLRAELDAIQDEQDDINATRKRIHEKSERDRQRRNEWLAKQAAKSAADSTDYPASASASPPPTSAPAPASRPASRPASCSASVLAVSPIPPPSSNPVPTHDYAFDDSIPPVVPKPFPCSPRFSPASSVHPASPLMRATAPQFVPCVPLSPLPPLISRSPRHSCAIPIKKPDEEPSCDETSDETATPIWLSTIEDDALTAFARISQVGSKETSHAKLDFDAVPRSNWTDVASKTRTRQRRRSFGFDGHAPGYLENLGSAIKLARRLMFRESLAKRMAMSSPVFPSFPSLPPSRCSSPTPLPASSPRLLRRRDSTCSVDSNFSVGSAVSSTSSVCTNDPTASTRQLIRKLTSKLRKVQELATGVPQIGYLSSSLVPSSVPSSVWSLASTPVVAPGMTPLSMESPLAWLVPYILAGCPAGSPVSSPVLSPKPCPRTFSRSSSLSSTSSRSSRGSPRFLPKIRPGSPLTLPPDFELDALADIPDRDIPDLNIPDLDLSPPSPVEETAPKITTTVKKPASPVSPASPISPISSPTRIPSSSLLQVPVPAPKKAAAGAPSKNGSPTRSTSTTISSSRLAALAAPKGDRSPPSRAASSSSSSSSSRPPPSSPSSIPRARASPATLAPPTTSPSPPRTPRLSPRSAVVSWDGTDNSGPSAALMRPTAASYLRTCGIDTNPKRPSPLRREQLPPPSPTKPGPSTFTPSPARAAARNRPLTAPTASSLAKTVTPAATTPARSPPSIRITKPSESRPTVPSAGPSTSPEASPNLTPSKFDKGKGKEVSASPANGDNGE